MEILLTLALKLHKTLPEQKWEGKKIKGAKQSLTIVKSLIGAAQSSVITTNLLEIPEKKQKLILFLT